MISPSINVRRHFSRSYGISNVIRNRDCINLLRENLVNDFFAKSRSCSLDCTDLEGSVYGTKEKRQWNQSQKLTRRQVNVLQSQLAGNLDASSGRVESWEEPVEWDHYSFADVAKGVLSLVLAEKLIASVVNVLKFPIPAPVIMLAAIGATMATNTSLSAELFVFHSGAVAFFDAWMPLFFAPSVAGIALAPLPAGAELARAALLLAATYTFHLWATSRLALSFQKLLNPRKASFSDPLTHEERISRIQRASSIWGKALAATSASALSGIASTSSRSDVRKAASAASSLLSQVAAKIELPRKLPPVSEKLPLICSLLGALALAPLALLPPTAQTAASMAPGLLLLTLGMFQAAKLLPPQVRKWLSPTVASGLAMAALCALPGLLSPLHSWQGGVLLYKDGAGVLLAALIGPAVAALGFKVHTQRALLEKSFRELGLACLVITPIGLLFTAASGRLLGASPLLTASLIPATTTLGLAREMVPLLGANRGLVVAGVTIAGTAGISTARQLLAHWKVEGAVARGMGVGSASHTLGASAIVVDEPQAAAVAGLTLALKGSIAVMAISVPQFRNLLLTLASPV